MPIVIDKVVTDVITRPVTEEPKDTKARGDSGPCDPEEIRRQIQRSIRLAARIATD